jgi:hypothetical protein
MVKKIMDSKSLLIEQAHKVNNLLSMYIEVHDNYVKSSGFIRSLFTKIDFNKLANDAQLVNSKMSQLQTESCILKDKIKGSHGEKFADALCKYCEALAQTTHSLFLIVDALQKKAKGESLSLSEHMKNQKNYEESILTYSKLGDKLNFEFRSF